MKIKFKDPHRLRRLYELRTWARGLCEIRMLSFADYVAILKADHIMEIRLILKKAINEQV